MREPDRWAYAWVEKNRAGEIPMSDSYRTMAELFERERWFEGLEVVLVRQGRIVDE